MSVLSSSNTYNWKNHRKTWHLILCFFLNCSKYMGCIVCYSSHADVEHDNLNGCADEIYAWKNVK